jgi:hypothetical protein
MLSLLLIFSCNCFAVLLQLINTMHITNNGSSNFFMLQKYNRRAVKKIENIV